MAARRVAVVGAGWAGLAAAVAAAGAGHQVTVLEASRQPGGRARRLDVTLPDGDTVALDNGQHILIGAYTQTLALMRQVGVDPARVLRRLPLTLRFPDGDGLVLPDWPAPLDAGWGIVRARGWTAGDRFSLLRHAAAWQLRGYSCDDQLTVAELCAGLSAAVLRDLVEPLCVAALNTPADRSSAKVFLRVLRDSLFGPSQGGWGSSNLLLPRADLGALFPRAAADWLLARGASVQFGTRVQALVPDGAAWRVDGLPYDDVLLAAPPWEAARLAAGAGADAWAAAASGLSHEAIATTYTVGGPRFPLPLLALRSGPGRPAQFVFDRGHLGGPPGLLAWVASASGGDAATVEEQVVAQARSLGWRVHPVRTVVEKRATFACTPGLRRPGARVAPGLYACGDYVDGPYPATLEGAVRSALEAAALVGAPLT
ncbi:MAG: FAD-binding protein [Comamonadaceae bacterium]|nr:MAG: FAD-binding protein [Comamonadaceae bacterium]